MKIKISIADQMAGMFRRKYLPPFFEEVRVGIKDSISLELIPALIYLTGKFFKISPCFSKIFPKYSPNSSYGMGTIG